MLQQNIYRFIKKYSSEVPVINRLFVSAYFWMHKAEIWYTLEHFSKKNLFFLPYIIHESNEDEYKVLLEFVTLWRKEKEKMTLEDLIQLFEYVVSPSDRIVNGAIYTPNDIRNYIVLGSLEKYKKNINASMKTVDISCGCWWFLVTMAQALKKKLNGTYEDIFKKNIYGLDIQPYSVERTKILLSLLMVESWESVDNDIFNIFCGDSLTFDWEQTLFWFEGFDIIVGNPPYVCARNLDEATKTNIAKWSVSHSGNTDLYIPFFQIGMKYLRDSWILGFITMNTFFKSLNGRALRAYFQEEQFPIEIFDFRTYQVFPSRNTYTCICFIEKAKSGRIKYHDLSHGDLSKAEILNFSIPYDRLDAIRWWNLREDNIITKIESVGIPFSKRYNTRHGIATLKNDIYIFSPVAEDDLYFFLEKEGKRFPIERGLCKKILNANMIHTQDPNAVKFEQLIFPYTSDILPRLFSEKFLQKTFPKGYKYLLAQKEVLSMRDKWNGNYEAWFAFWRTQSLQRVQNKLFFPKMTNKPAKCLMTTDPDLYFYNGQAVMGQDESEMQVIKKILESELFWYYIQNTSKPYSWGYYSLNGAYIANFGIYDFSKKDKEYILLRKASEDISKFIKKKYEISE